MAWCTFIAFIVALGWIKAQEYIENLHDSKYGTHVVEIPKSFEIQGNDGNAQFQKYFNKIQEIARQDNVNVVYKIKIEVQKPKKYHGKRVVMKKGKSKKYNVPLKKASMKLSNFEVWLRKMAEQSGSKTKGHQQDYESYPSATTEREKLIVTTKQIQLKYKPIISRVKTNYTKHVKPVRNRIITLTK